MTYQNVLRFPSRRIRSQPSLASHPSIHKITENAGISLPFKWEYRSKGQIYWPEFQLLRLLTRVITSLQHFRQTADGSLSVVPVPKQNVFGAAVTATAPSCLFSGSQE